MTRGRFNVAASLPATGSSKVSVNVIGVWEPDADPRDVEQAIKDAARAAIRRFREQTGHPYLVPEMAGQLSIPIPGA